MCVYIHINIHLEQFGLRGRSAIRQNIDTRKYIKKKIRFASRFFQNETPGCESILFLIIFLLFLLPPPHEITFPYLTRKEILNQYVYIYVYMCV